MKTTSTDIFVAINHVLVNKKNHYLTLLKFLIILINATKMLVYLKHLLILEKKLFKHLLEESNMISQN